MSAMSVAAVSYYIYACGYRKSVFRRQWYNFYLSSANCPLLRIACAASSLCVPTITTHFTRIINKCGVLLDYILVYVHWCCCLKQLPTTPQGFQLNVAKTPRQPQHSMHILLRNARHKKRIKTNGVSHWTLNDQPKILSQAGAHNINKMPTAHRRLCSEWIIESYSVCFRLNLNN